MNSPAVISIEGRNYELPALPQDGQGGGFAFSLAKGGSVLLSDALHYLCHASPIRYLSLPNHLAELGVAMLAVPIAEEQRRVLFDYMKAPGVVFGGWRRMPVNFSLPVSPITKTFLLVRDPRDMLMSYYFHFRDSAPTTDAFGDMVAAMRAKLRTMTIDEFALYYTDDIRERFDGYCGLGENSDLMLRRYEDIVFDKPALLDDLCAHFGIDVSPERKAEIAATIDLRPPEENTFVHVRQVTPGDHVRKLRPDTIAALNERLGDILRLYGYR